MSSDEEAIHKAYESELEFCKRSLDRSLFKFDSLVTIFRSKVKSKEDLKHAGTLLIAEMNEIHGLVSEINILDRVSFLVPKKQV